MACLPIVDAATLKGFCIHLVSLVLIIFDWLEETRYFRVRQMHRLDVVTGQHFADLVEYRPHTGQECD
jgi:hypothetical protein